MKINAGTTSEARHRHWFPAANAGEQPSPWWYFARAVYVSRRDYRRIFYKFIAAGIPLGAIGVLFQHPLFFKAAVGLAILGLLMLAYSLIGLYRMYGHPAAQYLRRLLRLGGVEGKAVVADLHIGTYRHSYALADLLPQAQIHSIDCWNVDGPPAEAAVQDVRDLEPAPAGNPRIHPATAENYNLPLADASCDVVVFGFGTHELPTDGPRQKLFEEAARILKPGGKVLMFEHGYDFHNYLIFGPVIHHVTRRQEWLEFLKARFGNVVYARSSHAVDLMVATYHA